MPTAVKTRRNPAWTREEIILALDLYLRSGRKLLDDSHAEVIALSRQLNQLPIHRPAVRADMFRNPGEVTKRLASLRRLDPAVPAVAISRGNRREQEIWAQFAADPGALSAAVAAIAELANSNAPAATVNRWWLGRPRQRFWVEVTSRSDVGTDLRAPQTDESGQWYWGYGLINEIRPGDVVLHFDQNADAFIGMSRTVGTVWTGDIRWAARGTYARAKRIEPHNRPGWYLGLEEFTLLPTHVGKDVLEEHRAPLVELVETLEKTHGEPLYFPLMLYKRGRPISPQQAYLTKCPVEFLELLPDLAPVLRFADADRQPSVISGEHLHLQNASPMPQPRGGTVDAPIAREPSSEWGSEYRNADEEAAVSQRDPFDVDPAHVERSLRGHASTQNALAAWLRDRGYTPRSPGPCDPLFDLAWKVDATLWVAEVKSLTDANEEKQLRLALGQVLRYRHLLGGFHAEVMSVIAIERAPKDRTWIDLCASHDVRLVWPGAFDSLR